MIDWKSKRQRCPSCGRDGEKGQRGTLGVTVNADGSAIAHCFRCQYVETTEGAVAAGQAERQKAARSEQRHERLSDYGRELWRACRPICGDGAAYLEARRCVIPPADGDLRSHPALKHPPSGTVGPALVALVTDAVTGEPLTLHRTWIRADGSKAPLEPARMLLGNHRKAGGVIRLWPDEAVTLGLGVAEGIETALSLAHAYRPVWSLIDAGNLGAFPVLSGIEALMIAADHDPAGNAAAERCAERWDAAGREAYIVRATEGVNDLNDLVRLGHDD